MLMQTLIALGAVGGAVLLLLNNSFAGIPKPESEAPAGQPLPPPRFLYSDPAIWLSSPVDVTYRPYTSYMGSNNDPMRHYLLPGGSRVPLSGYNPVGQTNQVWLDKGPAKAPQKGTIQLKPKQQYGIGVKT